MTKVTDVLVLLPKLTQGELGTVRAAVEHLLTGGIVDSDDDTKPLYDMASAAVGRGYLSFYQFQKMAPYRVWKRDAKAVVQFIEKTFPESQKVTKMAITSFLVAALVDDMREIGIPITLGTITNHISRLPEMLEKCFPGYVASGLTHLIIKAMERK